MRLPSPQVENDIETLREEIEGHDTAELARKRSRMRELGREEGRIDVSLNQQKDKPQNQI